MTFLQKSYGDWSKVEKPVLFPISYEGSEEDDDDVKMVPVINQNNSNDFKVVSDSKSNDKANKNLFNKDVNDEVDAVPKNIVKAKVGQSLKKLQTSYNKDAKRIVKEAA